jgi:hypothetical protein
MHQNKKKILHKQCNQKTDGLEIKELLENRCTKMHIGIYTKQIGNPLDNLVLKKNRYLNSRLPYQTEIVKKESHFSHSKPRRTYKIYSQT